MKFYDKLHSRSNKVKSLLCVGLDPEIEKIPLVIQKEQNPLFEFCKHIVDATHTDVAAYKPNIAFFERYGSSGIKEFELLLEYLKKNYPGVPIIADVKRGDLANTAKEYAKYYFGSLCVDSITVSPYMGCDSLEPFLEYENSFLFALCLTSNKGAEDFQKLVVKEGNIRVYDEVASAVYRLNKDYPDRVGIVVGATYPGELKLLRKKFPDMVFLIPGFGAQGGELLDTISISGLNSVVNSSRSIIYHSNQDDFAEKALQKVKEINQEMQVLFR
ncbi:MAG: orotidine-5'-phosphate decarboxylase [Leptospiraceae bacterium]|nr:orotidine-5'-phosphate decarboxylase [Leptospiraceae bacterium]MCP5494778.1 orotidine-5'-phosphate decarboxylase [Leptospiraceae bacterium]